MTIPAMPPPPAAGDAAASLSATLRRAIRESTPAGQRSVVLIDGRSGAGKSTLADRLVADWPGVQLVRLDDLYPGWDGLEAGSADVAGMIAAGVPGWREWDWSMGLAGAWHPLIASRDLLIEGTGTLSASNRASATFGIWVELDDEARRARALTRGGVDYEPHWQHWAEQEAAFIARENPRGRADIVVSAISPSTMSE